MNAIEVIEAGLTQARRWTLASTRGLTQEQLSWRPSRRCNSMGFILWHVGRIEDLHTHDTLRRGEHVWITQKWYEKLGLPKDDTGFGYTPEQVGQFPVPPFELILDYMASVRRETLDYLHTLTEAQLDERPFPDQPERQVGPILIRVQNHECHHQGQIDYLKGLWKPSEK